MSKKIDIELIKKKHNEAMKKHNIKKRKIRNLQYYEKFAKIYSELDTKHMKNYKKLSLNEYPYIKKNAKIMSTNKYIINLFKELYDFIDYDN
jgi:hypothetical protein